MNKKLSEQIAYHILANLGVLPSSFVNKDSLRTITDKQFLLPEKISFEGNLRKNVYGCQATVADNKELRLMLADCTQEKDLPEFCLLVQLKDAPVFGVYLVYTQLTKEPMDPEVLIGISTDEKYWMPCSTYLQATFLAGMEQIRDVGFGWGRVSDYDKMYHQLLSFIKFHRNFYGEADEGQEE